MIQYLEHEAIDKKKWDDCINNSMADRIYALSWYLDSLCPQWEALVVDEYEAVFWGSLARWQQAVTLLRTVCTWAV